MTDSTVITGFEVVMYFAHQAYKTGHAAAYIQHSTAQHRTAHLKAHTTSPSYGTARCDAA